MVDFTILVLPMAMGASVTLTLDILSTAAGLSARIGTAQPTWRFYSPGVERPTQLTGGVQIDADPLPRTVRAGGSTWVVPGLPLESACEVADRFAQQDALRAVHALEVQAREGATVAASCSSVFLLQAAGLLKDKKVTTAWWLAPYLQQLEPRCQVDAGRLVVADGNIVTGGAALSQGDLMLQLLRMRFGTALADAVSRVLVLDRRQAQGPYIVPAMLANGNELIAKLTARIDLALPRPPSVADLAIEFGMSERTLARHVRAATGSSTLALIQSVRVNKARMLLETSRLTVEQVAERVGYADATALHRLMLKVAGATPRQFRPTAR
ncbi:GlxA family transcriptional regulator [Caldimonas brevitalea]|uniref:AraC family transcriptional regulator n=1 Tax=Caldimonas brevitalea TaxID=413882 RepID=A0A0G3BI89_9BURK|nr:helix-turn-helix domain-containing protein [Caldimonas brevitalea]AKJ27086.1 AraC family transcriptional regulator [Caldimonas brevitalea]